MPETANTEFWREMKPLEAPARPTRSSPYEHEDPMRVHFNVTGPLIWLDDAGEPSGTFDVFDNALCKEHYDKVGIGGDHVETLFR